jgi:uncharacterized protein (TIGR03435 family)
VRTPVWNRTGLPGKYSFAFRFTQGVSQEAKVDAPLLATALEENLGLKLVKQRGSVETLIVDSIEEPAKN